VLLSQTGGESLPTGPFVKTYQVVPSSSFYVVCAYLDQPPARYPDAWDGACFVFPYDECYLAVITPPELISGEAEAKLAYEEALEKRAELKQREEQGVAQRRAEEEAAARAANEAAAVRQAAEEAQRRAADSPRCDVPALRGHTLRGAKRLLIAAHCKLGKITIRRHGHGALRVTAQSPRRGRALEAGTSVTIVLGSSET
jgi:hypothetical protein